MYSTRLYNWRHISRFRRRIPRGPVPSRSKSTERGKIGSAYDEFKRFFVVSKYRAPEPVLRIRIHRIHMFLGLPDPDPLVRGMIPDPDQDPSIIMQK